MALPFDLTPPEKRPYKGVFFTDEETGRWLEDMAQNHGLEFSLIIHRIVRQARESASPSDGERRSGDRRATA